jgi:5-methylcytosine-specific restriction endonuclease McrA
MKRKAISKKMREAVYNKYDGHCAYCGKELEPKGWQLDHLIPYQLERFGRYTEEQIECFENYMPACRRCNHYKRAHSLEVFRRYIKEIPEKLKETNYIYKVGLDYGIIEEHPWNGLFYFEWLEKNCKE